MADSVPFSGLPHILQDLADERVWVYAEWIRPEYAPRTDGDWTPGYHGTRHPQCLPSKSGTHTTISQPTR